MKLSFSTKGWHGYTFEQFCDTANELGFKGIEIHNVASLQYQGQKNAFSTARLCNAAVRMLYERKLSIACVDSIYNPAQDCEKAQEEILSCIEIAYNLRTPYVRIRALSCANDEEAEIAKVRECISAVLPEAQKRNITLIIETVGLFADTNKLFGLLNFFASDYLGALWEVYSPYKINGESPEDTIRNLGAYVKHVHLKDYEETENDAFRFCLIGEGSLPIDDIMGALRSVNYDGFISLEWDPAWLPEISEMDIVFAHFENYMRRFGEVAKAKSTLYKNKAGNGKFVYKKEILIEETFSQVLDRMVQEFPDQYAIKYTTLDYTRTYEQFRDDVDEFARSLIALGVKKGTHVAVWATNVPQWFVAFWATVKIGAVLVTVNTAYKIHEAEYLLRQSDAHTLVMVESCLDSNYREIIAEICPELEYTQSGEHLHSKRLPFLRNVITVGFSMPGAMTWEHAQGRASEVPVEEVYRMAANVSKDDVCNMQYTSGTTGFPKGVMLTHYNIVNNGKCIGDRMDFSTADRLMIQVPMFHCFGMVLAMTAAMTHAVTILPLPYFSAKSALACIDAEKITAFHGVPTMFIAMLEHEDFNKTDFSYVRTGIMAGSPCPVSVMRDVLDKMNMKDITIVYGQTEASPGCTMSSTDDSIEVRVSTVGHPLPEIECKIIDPETGEECPDEVTGEFVTRGYHIMKGYYKMPSATASAIDSEGWLHTGDLACRTPAGDFKITGRLKDMIIRGGENIYPKEIEEYIYTHKSVKDVQVIGVPDKQYGEEIMACIILKDGEELSADEMREYVRSRMAKHKVPKYVSFVTEFPMNAAGKIQKFKMRENAVKELGLEQADSVVTA